MLCLGDRLDDKKCIIANPVLKLLEIKGFTRRFALFCDSICHAHYGS